MKYIELFKNGFDKTLEEKIKPENYPYVGYSPSEGLRFTIVSKEDGYTLIALKKVDISNITYEEVDLGLSVKWANKNIGAQTEEDYGTYFSWGNTDGYTVSGTKFLTVDEACQVISSEWEETITTKEEFENILSQFGMTADNLGTVDGYSFDENTYNTTSGVGFSGDVLDPEHDAATVNIGGEWRMPTIDEYRELVNAVKTSAEDTENPLTCTYIYLDKQGNRTEHVVYRENTTDYFWFTLPEHSWILGVKFTNASTDASVYFPVCGYVDQSLLIRNGIYGDYWSSSISDDTTKARNFYFGYEYVNAYNSICSRYFGVCVRAVK